MCTLVAIHRRIPGAPLVIAANRDEYLERPSEGPAVRTTPDGPVLAPRDLRAGGTWLGLSARGVFAAVTNRRCTSPDPRRRSRGLVVMDMLAAPDAASAAQRLEELPQDAHNPFNAFVADANRAYAMVYQDGPQVKELGPGAHVIGNADPNAASVPKVARVMARADAAASRAADDVLGELKELCCEHGPGDASLDDTCVHLQGYGTRSSMLLLLAEEPARSRFHWADGPPCQARYNDFTPLLGELSETASYASGESRETRKVS